MKFEYILDGDAGWAAIIFEHNGVSLTYSITECFCDNITQLLFGILKITNKVQEKVYDADDELAELYVEEEGVFKWHIDEEGSEAIFLFTLLEDKKNVKLQITELSGGTLSNHETEECVFDGNINLNELIDCVLNSCSNILNKYGILGYYRNFWHDFPVTGYLALKDYKEKKLAFEYVEETIFERVKKMNRTNIEDEVKYLITPEENKL